MKSSLSVQGGNPQALAAIARAHEQQRERGACRRRWRADPLAGHREAAVFVLAPPWWLERAKVGDVLTWLPRVGPGAARRMLLAARADAFDTMAEVPLSVARRLHELLGDRVARIESETCAAA